MKPLYLMFLLLGLSACEQTNQAGSSETRLAQSAVVPSHVTALDDDETRARAIAAALEGDLDYTAKLVDYYGMIEADPDNQQERWLQHAIDLGDPEAVLTYASLLYARARPGDCEKAAALADAYESSHPEEAFRVDELRSQYTRHGACPR